MHSIIERYTDRSIRLIIPVIGIIKKVQLITDKPQRKQIIKYDKNGKIEHLDIYV